MRSGKLDPIEQRSWAAAALALLLLAAAAAPVQAFCGFYVTGADAKLYANATMVVLMRDGTRTVLSMQNNYQGPPEQFALVIPVPAVLQKDQVKVLPKDVFQRVDTLGAPRLVEYWEQDPCFVPRAADNAFATAAAAPGAAAAAGSGASAPVRVEAQFAVGEYDVVILSADDSSALDGWLRQNKYNIPEGAQPVLQPYVAAGMKFFVAKVDPARVTFSGNQAALSPLRFHYDSQEFSLPVRLGLLNSQGSQDLIVNILATQRYELANYPNVTVPTNIRVQNDVRSDFASFYEALFSKVIDKNPKSVVTEYAWASNTCDPCPGPTLTPTDLTTLGADVLQNAQSGAAGTPGSSPAIQPVNPAVYNMTLTRLHARYGKESLGEDLVFKVAPGITGGRGMPDTQGLLDPTTQVTGYNNFQGRYVILHPWESPISCQSPRRGLWGGPGGSGSSPAKAPTNNALLGAAPMAGDLPALLAESLPALDVKASSPLEPLGVVKPTPAANGGAGGKGGSAATTTAAAGSKSTPPFNPNTPAVKPVARAAGSGAATSENKVTESTRSSGGCSVSAAGSGKPAGSWWLVLAGCGLLARRSGRRARG
jgi:hypothetical protein